MDMSATKPYTIGELARQAELPTTTIRFYERQGLIKPERRSGSNYRLYSAESVERLRFIRAAKEAGFTVENIRTLLLLKDDAKPPSQEVEHLVEQRLESVTEQIHQLRTIERILGEWLMICRDAQKCGRCGVLDQLEATSRRAQRSTGKKAGKKSGKTT